GEGTEPRYPELLQALRALGVCQEQLAEPRVARERGKRGFTPPRPAAPGRPVRLQEQVCECGPVPVSGLTALDLDADRGVRRLIPLHRGTRLLLGYQQERLRVLQAVRLDRHPVAPAAVEHETKAQPDRAV